MPLTVNTSKSRLHRNKWFSFGNDRRRGGDSEPLVSADRGKKAGENYEASGEASTGNSLLECEKGSDRALVCDCMFGFIGDGADDIDD